MPRLDSFFFTLPGFHVVTGKNIKIIYLVRLLRDLLNKVTLFFLPIFLFNFGKVFPPFERFSFTDIQAGMIMIAVFYVITRIVILFTAIPLGKIMVRLPYEMSLLAAYIFRIIVFTSLFFATQFPYLILVAAVFEGLQSNLFWNSFFTLLTQTITDKSGGKEIGMLHFLMQLVTVLSPAISGYFALQYGLELLFLLGIVISLVSALFIIGMHIRLPQDSVSWQEFGQWLKQPSFLRATGSFVGKYINDSLIFLWPLYIFLVVGTVERVGFLYTMSLFAALVITFFLGGYIDRLKSNRRPFFFSGGALSLVWLARTQLFTFWGIAISDTVERLLANFHWLFYDVLFIKRGKGSQAFSYFVYREMVISITAVLFWACFSGFFLASDSWAGVFIFGGIGVLLSLLLAEKVPHEKAHHSEIKP